MNAIDIWMSNFVAKVGKKLPNYPEKLQKRSTIFVFSNFPELFTYFFLFFSNHFEFSLLASIMNIKVWNSILFFVMLWRAFVNKWIFLKFIIRYSLEIFTNIKLYIFTFYKWLSIATMNRGNCSQLSIQNGTYGSKISPLCSFYSSAIWE